MMFPHIVPTDESVRTCLSLVMGIDPLFAALEALEKTQGVAAASHLSEAALGHAPIVLEASAIGTLRSYVRGRLLAGKQSRDAHWLYATDDQSKRPSLGDLWEQPPPALHARASSLLMRTLVAGRSGLSVPSKREFTEWYDQIATWSTDLKLRSRLRGPVVYGWLKGRSDLLPYLAVLLKFVSFGKAAFDSLVSSLVMGASLELILECDAVGVFDCSFEDCYANLKVVQEYARLRGIVLDDGQAFGEQYVSLLLGRVDNEIFHDYDDAVGRDDPKRLRRPNYMSKYVHEYHRLFRLEVEKEARRFSSIIEKRVASMRREGLSDDAIADRVRPENNYLSSVAAGGIGGYVKPMAMQGECPSEAQSKKILFAYMHPMEARKVYDDPKNFHTYTKVFFKTEEKARLLAAGSQAAYYHQNILSSLAETEFLSTLPETPMQWTAARKQRFYATHHSSHLNAYNICRDFKNFNECIPHEVLEKSWFAVIAAQLERAGAPGGLVVAATACATMMRHVGVYVGGVAIPWLHGLQSGWRMTMLLNTVMNVCMGRAARSVVTRVTGITFYACLHQGDDSKESCSSPWGGPMVQALLDAAGMPGAPLKQLFPSKRGGGFEFLREWITPTTRTGSAVRAACRFTCPDLQSPVPVGGVDMAGAVVTTLEKVRRRVRVPLLRARDMELIAAYWCRSPEDALAGRPAEWRAVFLPASRGGLGITSTLIDPDRFNGTVTIETEVRQGITETSILEAVVKHKLPKIQKAAPLARYSAAFTRDVIEASRGTRQLVEKSNITSCPGEEYRRRVAVREREYRADGQCAIVENALEYRLFHRAGREVSEEQSAVEYLVASQFGGSEQAARAWVRDGAPMFGHFPTGKIGKLCKVGVKALRDTKPAPSQILIPTCLPQEWLGTDTLKYLGSAPTAVGKRWYTYTRVWERVRRAGWFI